MITTGQQSRQQDRFGLVALSVVGVAGALLNLGIVRELAVAAGYNDAASWLYWLVLDFFAVIAMRGAFRAQTDKVRQWAGGSSVFALLLSATAAGFHVFIEGEVLPPEIAFGVLCLPAVMVGLSLHLVLLMHLEGRQADRREESKIATVEVLPERVADATGDAWNDDEVVVREQVTHQRQVTSRRTGKTAMFVAALKAAEPADTLTVNAVVAELNPGIDLHEASARKLVAQYRRGELS